MNYDVVWVGTAENHLAEIWLSSRWRDAITRTARNIDRNLADHPLEVGESRELGKRVLLMPPLGVLYEVNDDARQVRVLRVWHIRRRNG